MRTTTLAMTLLTLALGQVQADPPKSKKPDVGPGRVAWFDITTRDLPKSRDFHGKLFGWTFTSLQGTDLAVEIVAAGTAIGTLRVAEGQISPFNGVAYVQVDDIQASCRKATELGGKVVPGFPFNLSDGAGAVGLVVDPAGHPIGLYSPTPLPSTPASK
jgi:uncharacterized protein